MDSSHLVRAHDHARAAAVATRQGQPADTTVAMTEHTQAAGEFASAATSTSSVEALRMLKLLEDHHRRLAELLNLPAGQQQQPQASSPDETASNDEKKTTAPTSGEKTAASTGTSSPVAQEPAKSNKMAPPRRLPSREMSSSIASNLASARGIRSSKYRGQPLSPSVSNDQAGGNVDARSRRHGSEGKMANIIESQTTGRPTWVPPTGGPSSPSSSRRATAATTARPTDTNANPADDGGYTKFYNTFGSLMNRISSPLAFAGLPLGQASAEPEEQPEEQPAPAPSETPSRLSKRRSQASTSSSLSASSSRSASAQDADLSKIYSRATMRAMENDGYAASESFYVVPTSGHTISYANILSYAEKEKRRLAGPGTVPGTIPEEDDFVDARESAGARALLSPGAQRRVGRARSERDLSNTIEELYTENKSLKDMLDKLTKRLHTFEASAQKMSESFSLMRPGSPVATTSGAGRAEASESEFLAMRKHAEKVERENRKMHKTLERYREQWETLKAGAKARREAQSGAESVEDARQS